MSDAEDDYLSDKFVTQASAAPSSSSNKKPSSYAELRRRAERESEIKNLAGRRKSRRQLEEDSVREGLGKSLFERAKEAEEAGLSQGSKAMAMMLKMGYKPGQSLGQVDEPPPPPEKTPDATAGVAEEKAPVASSSSMSGGKTPRGHLLEPLRLDKWSGREGVGKRKRVESAGPAAAAKLARVVKAEGSFRDRARLEYEERRAEGRLASAARTCETLDEKAGKSFNVLWLNPLDPESFPPELLERIAYSDLGLVEEEETVAAATGTTIVDPAIVEASEADRLRVQMRADALQPLAEFSDDVPDDDAPKKAQQQEEADREFPPDVVNAATAFIRLNAQDRLRRLLAYLRDEYFYCFWCGMQYTDLQDLNDGCPGSEEDAHD